MLKNKTTRSVVIGAAVLAVVAGVAVANSASAANQPNGSQGAMYIGSGNTGAHVPAGTTSAFTDGNFGYGDPTNVVAPYTCPSDATGVASFVALAGQEYTVATWAGTAFAGFASGTKNISAPDTTLSDFSGTGTAAMKTTGGNYSVGIACTINSGSALASTGVYFASLHIAAGGAYTIDQPTVAGPTTPPTPPVGSQALTLKATTLAAQDGVLSLLAPASSTVLIGNPVLDPTTHLSVSTGKLGNVTVSDGRVVTPPGLEPHHRGQRLHARERLHEDDPGRPAGTQPDHRLEAAQLGGDRRRRTDRRQRSAHVFVRFCGQWRERWQLRSRRRP